MLAAAAAVLGFLGSPVGRYVAIGAIIVAAYGFGFAKGDAHGDKQCAAAALENQAKKHALEQQTLADQLASERKTAAALAAHKKAAEGKIHALTEQIAKSERARKAGKATPNAVAGIDCRVTPAGRLRHLGK